EELRDHVAAEGIEANQRADQERQQQSDNDEPAHQPNRARGGLFGNRPARDMAFGHNIHGHALSAIAGCPEFPARSRSRYLVIAASFRPMPRRMNSQSCRSGPPPSP